MNSDIDRETMKKIAWAAGVILLTVAAFLFFWKQKHQTLDSPLEMANLSESETEEKKIEKIHAMMEEGYVYSLSGQIKDVDFEKGNMEMEVYLESRQEKKSFRISFQPNVEIFKIVDQMGSSFSGEKKNQEAAAIGKRERIDLNKEILYPGAVLDFEASEMFHPEKTDSVRAIKFFFLEAD